MRACTMMELHSVKPYSKPDQVDKDEKIEILYRGVGRFLSSNYKISHGDYEDLIHEAILYMIPHLHRIENPEAYLHIVLKSKISRFIKYQNRFIVDHELANYYVDNLPRNDENVESKNTLNDIIDIIYNYLKPKEIEVLNLIMNGYDSKDISKITGYSDASIRQILSRSRKKIKKLRSD